MSAKNNDLPQQPWRMPHWMGIAILAVLTLAMFGNLFLSESKVLSAKNTDIYSQYYYWRDFGFRQLRVGHLPLWNPHIFSGAPFFGGFQSALLYPLNLPYLFLSVPRAINVGIALHVFLAGLFMYLWAAYRKLHPIACLLAGGLFMSCGAHFMHVYAGHLGGLCATPWVPLIFLAIDGYFDTLSLKWVLLGASSIGMQIIGTDPQYVFFTGVAASVYMVLCLFATRRKQAVLGFVGMYGGGVALSAVQLLTGLEAMRGSVRGDAVPYDFVTKFALPPENLLTLIAPGFFGDMIHFPYWGRCYLWEMSLFIGLTGLVLAVYGAFVAEGKTRRFSIVMIVVLLILALGAHTPLFRFLYLYVPGFNKFRGMSKFSLQMSLFLIMLAAIGMDSLMRRGYASRRFVLTVLVSAAVIIVAAVAIRSSASAAPDGIWRRALLEIPKSVRTNPSAESVYFPLEVYEKDLEFAKESGQFASKGLLLAAGTMIVLALVLMLSKVSRHVFYVLAALALAEVFIFGMNSRTTFDPANMRMEGLDEFLAEYPGDFRVWNVSNPNLAMSKNMRDVWGYAPLMSRRYAEFMTFMQGGDPDRASQYLVTCKDHRLFDILRCRYFMSPKPPSLALLPRATALEHIQLVPKYRIIRNRDSIFAAMNDPRFDPRNEVILEEEPGLSPSGNDINGEARIIEQTTDSLTIEADLSQPAILLVTDTWYKGWRAKALADSSQQEYKVMPADYVLRAVPLAAGHHHFRIEYMPRAFRIGAIISILSLVVFLSLVIRMVTRKARLSSAQ